MNLNVVLVQTKYSFNVGSVARVMSNMGASRLILISPNCELDHQARQGAAGAQTHLMKADIYKDWNHFFSTEPDGIRFGFCGKAKKQMESKNFALKLEEVLSNAAHIENNNFYFIFGAEDDGLSDSDLEFVNFIVQLPTPGEFKSLNLSHAVLLALYIFHQMKDKTNKDLATSPAESKGFYFPEAAIKDWLVTIGFDLENRDTSSYTVLKRLLLSKIATQKELKILEAIIFQTIRKLKKS